MTFPLSVGGGTVLAPSATKLALAALAPGAVTASEIFFAGSDEVYSSR